MKLRMLACLFALAAAVALAAQERVLVAAAANISAVKEPLGAAFAKQYPMYEAEFSFGASGALVTQIKSGAPFQVFMSADRGFAQALVDAGQTTGPAKIYAVGKLIFFTTRSLDLGKGLAVLKDASVLQWANCNPETAPYGRAAKEALTKAGLYDEVKAKLVTAQSVSQALQFALTSADAGFVNKSAIYSKDIQQYDKEGVFWFEVDPTLYAPIEQAFVVIKSTQASKGGTAFAAFLLSNEAQAVFAAYGYGKP
jgi:molybdate transport system substrate-binding protein